MTDFEETQQQEYVTTLVYLRRARFWLDDWLVGWRGDGPLEAEGIRDVAGDNYEKVMAAVKEHGGIDSAIKALTEKENEK